MPECISNALLIGRQRMRFRCRRDMPFSCTTLLRRGAVPIRARASHARRRFPRGSRCRSNVATLRGSYAGGFTFPALPESGCNLLSDLFRGSTTFNVSDTFLPGELSIVWGTGTDTFCNAHGAYVQRGALGRLDGFLSCQPLGSPLSTSMTITLADIAASDNGFNASAVIRRETCTYRGRFGGVRTP